MCIFVFRHVQNNVQWMHNCLIYAFCSCYCSHFLSVTVWAFFFCSRTTEVGCESDMEFLAKVHCVRQASEVCRDVYILEWLHVLIIIIKNYCCVFKFKCFWNVPLCLKFSSSPVVCKLVQGVSEYNAIQTWALFIIFPKLVNIPVLEIIPFTQVFSIISVQFWLN